MSNTLPQVQVVDLLCEANQQVEMFSRTSTSNGVPRGWFWCWCTSVLVQAEAIVRRRDAMPLISRPANSIDAILETLRILAESPQAPAAEVVALRGASATIAIIGADIFEALPDIERLLRLAPDLWPQIACFFDISIGFYCCDARKRLFTLLADDLDIRTELLRANKEGDDAAGYRARLGLLVNAAAEQDATAWNAAWDGLSRP